MDGRQYRAYGTEARTVGVLTMSSLGLQLEMQCRATLFFGWPRYEDLCRSYLSRTEWSADEVAVVAAMLQELATIVGFDELGRRAAKGSKHWQVPVMHYVTVWAAVTAFFCSAAKNRASVKTSPISDEAESPQLVSISTDEDFVVDSTLKRDINTWRNLLTKLPESQEIVFYLVQQNADLLYDFEGAFLDTFQAANTSLRMTLASQVGEALRHSSEQVVQFGLQVAQSSVIQSTLERRLGYRTSRQLLRLTRSKSFTVRHTAESVVDTYADDAVRQLRAAARGHFDKVGEGDWRVLLRALEEAQEWFADTISNDPKDIHESPAWSYIDYAHYLLTTDGGPHFPVPLEALCRQMGIAIVRSDFRGDFDGVLVQVRGLPGPVIVINTTRCVGYRERFTIAHEIAHAVLPWHAHRLIDMPSVEETTAIRPQEVQVSGKVKPINLSVEKEADKFAAYLLMPPKWFGPEVRRVPFTLDGLTTLQEAFGVSLSAAAFNAIHHTRDAVALVYTVNGQCRYRQMSDEFRDIAGADAELSFRPNPGTGAHELLSKEAITGSRVSQTVRASAWLSGRIEFETLRESSVTTFTGNVLTILEPDDEE